MAEKGRLLYIDPNELSTISKDNKYISSDERLDNVYYKPEDLNINVDLQVIVPDRTDCGQINYNNKIYNLTTKDTSEGDIRYVSFMGGSPINSGDGKKEFLTTDYTEVSYSQMVNGKCSNRETLGVSSINISFDSRFYPTVEMNFIDVRGFSLMMPEDEKYTESIRGDKHKGFESLYRAFFRYPYPRFLLSVKGFYGYKVTFMLALESFNTTFNAQTGNFEVKTTFIGYVYGLYVDLPMSLLLVSPFVEKMIKNDSQTTENGYWKGLQANGSVGGDGSFDFKGGTKIPTFIDYLRKYATVEAKGIDNKTIEEHNKSVQLQRACAELKGLYDEFISILTNKDCKTVIDDDYIYFQYQSNSIAVGYLKAAEEFFEPFLKKYKEYKEEYGDSIPSNSFCDKYATISNPVPDAVYVEDSGNKSIRFENYSRKLEAKIEEISDKLDSEEENLAKEASDSITSALGFTPSVENIYRMLFAHMDCFMNQFYDILDAIVNSKRKLSDLGLTIGKTDIDSKSKDDFVPPYPAIYENDGEGEKKLVYPGEITSLKNSGKFYEIDFVENIVNATTSVVKQMNDINKILNSGDNDSDKSYGYYPLKMDDILYGEINPYSDIINDSDIDDDQKIGYILYEFALRYCAADIVSKKMPNDDKIAIESYNIYKVLTNSLKKKFKDMATEDGITKFENCYTTKDGELISGFGRKTEYKNYTAGTQRRDLTRNGKTEYMYIIPSVFTSIFKKRNNAYSIKGIVSSKPQSASTASNRGIMAPIINYWDNTEPYDRACTLLENPACPITDKDYIKDKIFYNGKGEGDYKRYETQNYKFLYKISDGYKASAETISKDVWRDAISNPNDYSLSYLKVAVCDKDGNYTNKFKKAGIEVQIFDGLQLLACLPFSEADFEECIESVISVAENGRQTYTAEGPVITDYYYSAFKSRINKLSAPAFMYLCGLVYYKYGCTTADGRIEGCGKYPLMRKYIQESKAYYYVLPTEEKYRQEIDAKNSLLRFIDMYNDEKNYGSRCGKFIIDFLALTYQDWVAKVGSKLVRGINDSNNYKNGILDPSLSYTKDLTNFFLSDITLLKQYNENPGLVKDDIDSFKKLNYGNYDGAMNENCITSLIDSLKEKIDKDKLEDETELVDDVELDVNPEDISKENKLAVYYTLKMLYDKWLATYNRETFKLNTYDVDHAARKKRYNNFDKNANFSNSNEYSNFVFVDTFFNDIGQDMMINPTVLFDLVMANGNAELNYSVMEFMYTLAQKNDLLFVSLPIYNNFYNIDNLVETFTPHSTYASTLGMGNTYMLMYTNLPSQVLSDNNEDSTTMLEKDGFDICNTLENNKVLQLTDVFVKTDENGDKLNYSVPAFGVGFGMQNQSYFKNISVSMDSPRMTDYSIANILRISRGSSNADTVSPFAEGQDVFSLFSNRSYNCSVDMMGCMNIMPMMYFQLNNIPLFKGAYMITNVQHSITPGNITTSFTGMRMSKNSLPFNKSLFNLSVLSDAIGIMTERISSGNKKYTPANTTRDNANADLTSAQKKQILADVFGSNVPTRGNWKQVKAACTAISIKSKNEKYTVLEFAGDKENGKNTFYIPNSLSANVKTIFEEIYNQTDFVVNAVHSFRKDGDSNHGLALAIDVNAGSGGNPWFNHHITESDPSYKSIDNDAVKDWGCKKACNYGTYDWHKCIWSWDHPVVQIFNRHGWGWGGKYGDTMHFSFLGGN